MPTDIEQYLEEKKPIIDSLIKKHFPRSFEEKGVEKAFGKPRYSYDTETINKSLNEPVWDFLDRGGKRWRPALFLLVSEIFKADLKKVADFSILPELAHTGSIIIDDVEDEGELRRGKPCTHKQFGTDIAVNVGNFLYFYPLNIFMQNKDNIEPKTLIRAYEVYSQEMINIHLGQAMDIWWHKGKSKKITEEQYLQMCAYKTGTLARMSARLAVVLSGGSPEQEEKIGKVAESIGVGFQIQDDVLDIESSGKERDKFGKSFGNDIKEGKRTLMVIHAMHNAPEKESRRLIEILDSHTSDRKRVLEAIDILHKNGSVEYAKKRAREIVEKSWKEAESLLPECDAKETLKSFVNFLIEREH
jgi:geranylgeranyl pyrophosphate synthase